MLKFGAQKSGDGGASPALRKAKETGDVGKQRRFRADAAAQRWWAARGGGAGWKRRWRRQAHVVGGQKRICNLWCEAFAPQIAESRSETPPYVPLHHLKKVRLYTRSQSDADEIHTTYEEKKEKLRN